MIYLRCGERGGFAGNATRNREVARYEVIEIYFSPARKRFRYSAGIHLKVRKDWWFLGSQITHSPKCYFVS